MAWQNERKITLEILSRNKLALDFCVFVSTLFFFGHHQTMISFHTLFFEMNKKFVANNLYHVVQIIFCSLRSIHFTVRLQASQNKKKPLHSFRIHLEKSGEKKQSLPTFCLNEGKKTVSLNENPILLTFSE